MTEECNDLRRLRLDLHGRVQGVGFRPAVYRLATRLGLAGRVGNDVHGVFIEVEGTAARVAEFARALPAALPPQAHPDQILESYQKILGESSFRIDKSVHDGAPDAEVAPDMATCADCLAELCDVRNRRYGYPFTNCTNCGPRYSIVRAVPYDRVNTTMAGFVMCPACRAEYEDPGDRRFHAQPNACPVCGPRVWFAGPDGAAVAGDAICMCRDRLLAETVVAVKGLGGFHLACRADSDAAVLALRERKGREAKPLGVMVSNLAAAMTLVRLDPVSKELLTQWQRPIVLAPKLPGAPVSRHIAPGCDSFGIMLPYTPLHHLLLDSGMPPLVMTSANPSEEPLCHANDEAVTRLAGIADGFLMHDRDIEHPLDDSVLAVASECGRRRTCVVPVRRSRGYVPEPIRVPVRSPQPVLAVGGDLKGVVCVLRGDDAVLSEHLGELANPAAYRNFTIAVERFRRLLRVEPQVVAFDLHPEYVSTRYARGLGLHGVPVQHHHAHIAGCMAENGLTGPVLGLAADGTGYGTDGQIWGCELLLCDGAEFRRLGHLRYFPLPGGDLAAVETWRPALSLVYAACGPEWRVDAAPVFAGIPARAVTAQEHRLSEPGRLVQTSSLGRLFDAVAFILGVCARNRFEAEAAMALEALAAGTEEDAGVLEFGLDAVDVSLELDARPMVRSLLNARQRGVEAGRLARSFHLTLAKMLAQTLRELAAREGVRRVALSGGCFLNRLLLRMLLAELEPSGLEVYIHARVPPGDGGLALGQAVVAAAQLGRTG
ncbi:MAG: carbamoyltransferase HypF [Lentisphaerae bacterium RIFOXYB12_FULL_65_16]|nr:MAG: carbamoyltransferase HypF [Lentisphaerae bacterium RIFOXYB12_FULL_65_16]OGV95211.1 MAG: carbamoyltransferase HypF [Lentisphaerae bacterium RIFOXYB12_FULL_65_16]